jgi:pyruvate/2-oxoglutarate dehydrogenase complex dihydrolipoamide dehydrogenase (E3) component
VENDPVAKTIIIGGGPGGYEAALVARQLGVDVTLVEANAVGGSAVLTDVVPSKGLISIAANRLNFLETPEFTYNSAGLDISKTNERVTALAASQSSDILKRLQSANVEVVNARARVIDATEVEINTAEKTYRESADAILIATGARPRELSSTVCDGVRVLNWKQLYSLEVLPEHLIVIGSGVTGAEFASAYAALGSEVTLVSSRNLVLPSEDSDAARVISNVFEKRGISVCNNVRALSVTSTSQGVAVELSNGTELQGSHCLVAVGSTPNTADMGLLEAGVHLNGQGFVEVDSISRTNIRGIYAAGDCTGTMMLASVAAMQGRIAMRHAFGQSVQPLDLPTVAATVFTIPEIASVGVSAAEAQAQNCIDLLLPLKTNARAKMQNLDDGFIKLICHNDTRIVMGAVVVAPSASELIFALSLAVKMRLRVEDLADTLTVYPSLSGSIAEAARQLRVN